MKPLANLAQLDKAVRDTVAGVTISDIHTHLFPPSHDGLLLWGVDELLTYHYLAAELFTVAPREMTHERFWRLSKAQQADLIWQHVILAHGGLSEAARGVFTTLTKLGLGDELARRDLSAIRKWFAAQKVGDYLEKVFQVANLDYAIMTNNPFVPAETTCWQKDLGGHDRLRCALRIDSLILNYPAAAKIMRDAGYDTPEKLGPNSFLQARRYLLDWAAKLRPLYLAASLPNDFIYPSPAPSTQIIDEAVMPVAAQLGIPMALMIGVRKGVNPHLGDGGDGVGVADVSAVQHLLQRYPAGKFMVTMLSRDNQHELTVLARKFGNLHVEGCWWFLNNPSIIEEMTRMRLELLGTAFTAQHSDARVLDQLIYKWAHTRAVLADVLADVYAKQFAAGWRPTADEVKRDIRAILGGSFEAFCAK
jgi:hypothetical protein